MNFKDIIKQSILDNFTGDISFTRIVLVLGAATVFGVYIFFIYRAVINHEFYSKDFNRTLALMSVVTAAIVLAIQSNLVISLGMVGALSIVRFRTAVKSPMDLLFLFWSISIGIICGAGLYLLACGVCVVVTAILFLLDRIQNPTALGLLVINCKDLEACGTAEESVKPLTAFCRLKNKTVTPHSVEVIYEIKTENQVELAHVLSQTDGIVQFAFMNFDRETRI